MSAGASAKAPRIAIAGGGIIGLSIAWRLAQVGYRVTVFDKGQFGGEASWAGAGMLAPGGEIDEEDDLAAMALESRQLYSQFVHDLEDESALSIDFQECGGLDVAYSDAEMAELECRAQRQLAFGIRSKRISLNHLTSFWPRVNREHLVGGRFYPNDAIVNPRELTHALQIAGAKRGVNYAAHRQIRRISVAGDQVQLDTPGRYDYAVIAAGAWSNEIALEGVPPAPQVEPVKGQLLGYQQPEQTCNTILRHGRTYLLQRGNGLLIAGSSMERAGFDDSLSASIEADIAGRAGHVLPHLKETTHSESWMGFRPASESPHIGPWHSDRLYLAYGHFRNGVLLAPLTAERIAAKIIASWQTR